VSTDDPEIAAISKKVGASVVIRDSSKAADDTTLDPVIYDAYKKAVNESGRDYDLVVTLQPTSPLLRSTSLDVAINRIVFNESIETIISAKEDTHLSWTKKEGRYVPNYKERVNRQYLEPIFKETGGFLISRSDIITERTRIGRNVDLHLLNGAESIDVDTFEDWSLCEFYLRRKKILFVVSGYDEIGLGHVYNTLIVANDILNHHIEFLVDKKSKLAYDVIAEKNYRVHMQKSSSIIDEIRQLAPDVVINDRLDTDATYIESIKQSGATVINFEDLGCGAQFADLVINAIYPESKILPRHYFGHDYFILRDEFILTTPRETSPVVQSVLLTFGGTDANNLTYKVIRAIYEYCKGNDIKISVVAGFGYSAFDTLSEFENISVFRNSMSIADHMNRADVAFTSAGRTTYEVASLHVPSIVLAQNEREMSHFFASSEFGFLNLGLGSVVNEEKILKTFVHLVDSYATRTRMAELMAAADLTSGRKRVMKLINNVMEEI
jgi:spore coat polysaccharide biosynthesis predicted glycosyltransferase SpsG/CMP-N-acetylneuraminic acid synthetase